MGYKEAIAGMKCSTFPEARSNSVDVLGGDRKPIGTLVPVGRWILDDAEKIQMISDWRQRAMRMFLTQFESTAAKTRSYLEALSIGEAGRLLFLLYDGQERLVGHMGISNVNGQCGELDNVLRGVAGGEPRLVYFAEVTLLDWCFANLGLAESDLRLLSYNWMAASLHEEVGYKVVEKSFLRKYEKEGVTFHEPVDESLANVKYACLRMRLTKADFYARNGLH